MSDYPNSNKYFFRNDYREISRKPNIAADSRNFRFRRRLPPSMGVALQRRRFVAINSSSSLSFPSSSALVRLANISLNYPSNSFPFFDFVSSRRLSYNEISRVRARPALLFRPWLRTRRSQPSNKQVSAHSCTCVETLALMLFVIYSGDSYQMQTLLFLQPR